MNRLSDKITTSKIILNKTYFTNWLNIEDLLPDMLTTNLAEIPPAKVAKYRFDLIGLFKEYLNMDDKYIFPHILVNGYKSSSDFNCELLRFKLLDTSKLDEYDNFFRRTK